MRAHLAQAGQSSGRVFFAAIPILAAAAIFPLGAAETIEPRDGSVTAAEVDLRILASGVRIEIDRVYRSGRGGSGWLGAGWRSSLEKRILRVGAGFRIEEAGRTLVFTRNGETGPFAGPPGERLAVGLTTVVRRRGDGVSESYDVEGRLTEMRRPGGGSIAFRYDPAGRLERAEAQDGGWVRFATDAAGRLTRVESSSGAAVVYGYTGGNLTGVAVNGAPLVRYAYDAHNRLARIDDPRWGARELAYDAKGRVTGRRYADGAWERFEHDDAARTVRVTGPGGGTAAILRSPDGREEQLTDPMGRRSILTYDGAGKLLTATGPTGLSARYEYDALGRIALSGLPRFEARYRYVADTPLVESIAWSDGSRQTFEYDADGNLTEVKEGAAAVRSLRYFPNGQLASVKTRGQAELRFTYDACGRLLSETEVGGRAWRFEYDQRDNLIRRTDAVGRATGFAYDALNRLIAVTDASGAVTKYARDPSGRVAAVTDPAGRVTRYEYDERGRVTATLHPGGRAVRRRYDAAGRLTGITYPGAAAYSFRYDRGGSLTQTTNPLGGVTEYTYDALGQLILAKDAAGRNWRYEYSSPGRLARIVEPGERATRIQYDSRGRRVGLVDAAGRATRLERDTASGVTKLHLPGGTVRSETYEAGGRPASASSTTGDSVRYEYDAAGRLRRSQASSGREMSVEYDPAGMLSWVRDSTGASLAWRYNPQGLVAAVSDQAGLTTRIDYDPSGLPTRLVDPMDQARTLAYGPGGELIRISEANGDVVRLEYDAAGKLSAVHHPGGGRTAILRDAMSHPVEVVNPLGDRKLHSYDAAGRLAAAVDGEGGRTEYAYDDAGRLARERRPYGKTLAYEYDAFGRLLGVDDGAFPIRYAYDAAGRRIRIDHPAIRQSVSYHYDSSGLLEWMIDPSGNPIRYSYDAHARLSAITLASGAAIRFDYDSAGRLTALRYPNGVAGSWEWDPSGALARVSYRNRDGVEIDGWRYQYDRAGRPVREVSSAGQANEYRYDAAGQLTGETGPSGTVRYAYAAGGARRQKEAGGVSTVYRHNAAGQLVEAGGETFLHDRRGNLVERRDSRGVTQYVWDGKNRLVRIRKPGGGSVEYGYTAAGSRAWRKDKDGIRYFVTDGVNLLADVDGTFAASATYIHAPGIDRPVAMLTAGQAYFYHPKALGTISSVTDSAGKVAATYRTDAFGNLTGSTGTLASRLLFTGREYEADTGLYYYRARYYDPALGRFLSEDPDNSTLAHPIEGNRYAYARNSPLLYRDPMGTNTDPHCPTQADVRYWTEIVASKEEIGFLAKEGTGSSPGRWYPNEAAFNQTELGMTPEMVQSTRDYYNAANKDLRWWRPEDTEYNLSQKLQGPSKGTALMNEIKASIDAAKPRSVFDDLFAPLPESTAPSSPGVKGASPLSLDEPPVPLWESAVAKPPVDPGPVIPVLEPELPVPVEPLPEPLPEPVPAEPLPAEPAPAAAEPLETVEPRSGRTPPDWVPSSQATVRTPSAAPVEAAPVETVPETRPGGSRLSGVVKAATGAMIMTDLYLSMLETHDPEEALKRTGTNVAVGVAVTGGAFGVSMAGGAAYSLATGGTLAAGATAGAALAGPFMAVVGTGVGAYSLYERAQALPADPLPDGVATAFGQVTPPPETGGGFQSVASTEVAAGAVTPPAATGAFQSVGSVEVPLEPVAGSPGNSPFESDGAAAQVAAAMQGLNLPFVPPDNSPGQFQPGRAQQIVGVLNAFMGAAAQMQAMQNAATARNAQPDIDFLEKVQRQMAQRKDDKSQQNAQSLNAVLDSYRQYQANPPATGSKPVPATISGYQKYVNEQTKVRTGTGTGTPAAAKPPVLPDFKITYGGVMGACNPPGGSIVGLTPKQLEQYGCTAARGSVTVTPAPKK